MMPRKTPVFLVLLGVLLLGCSKPTAWEAAEAGALISPQGGAPMDTLTFVWHAGDAQVYWIQVDNSSTFATPVWEDSTVTDTLWRAPSILEAGTYYWRVRGKRIGEPWGPWQGPVRFTTPPEMIPLSFLETQGYVRDLSLDPLFPWVFYAQGQAGVGAAEISDLALLPLDTWDDASAQDNARGVFHWPGDSLVYLADTDGGVKILQWSDTAFSYLNSEFGRNLYDLTGWVFNDTLYLYVADQDDGVLVFRVETPGFLTLLTTIPVEGYAYGITTDGDHLYLAQGEQGIALFSLAIPAQPEPIATLDLPGNAQRVSVADTLLAVALKEAGIALVNVADPSHPAVLCTYDPFDGYAWDVALAPGGGTLFVAAGGGGFWKLDVRHPQAPVAVGRFTGPYALSVLALPTADLGSPRFLGGCRSGLYAF